MRITQSGPSELQQLLAQADIEASNRPTMTAAAAAQRSLAGRRAGHHHLSAAAEEAARPDRVLAPLNNAHIAALLARLRARNKRGAVTPEANDNAGELEELLLMLESQAQAQPPQRPVIRAGARQQGNAGEQSWQRRHDAWRGDDPAAKQAGAGSDPARHGGADAPDAIDAIDALLREHLAPAATRADPATGAHALEQALLGLHALLRAPAPNPPLTASLLRLTHACLNQPGISGPGTLAAVKQRLMAMMPPATGQSSPVLRQLHLFLPVLLLNAARPRTARQRDMALAKIAILLAGARRQPFAKL